MKLPAFTITVFAASLALAANEAAPTDGPASLAQVKSIALHADSSVIGDQSQIPAGAERTRGTICLAELATRLTDSGFVVREKGDAADADGTVTIAFRQTGKDDFELMYSVEIRSLPNRSTLLRLTGDVSDNLHSACSSMAKKVSSKMVSSKHAPTGATP